MRDYFRVNPDEQAVHVWGLSMVSTRYQYRTDMFQISTFAFVHVVLRDPSDEIFWHKIDTGIVSSLLDFVKTVLKSQYSRPVDSPPFHQACASAVILAPFFEPS